MQGTRSRAFSLVPVVDVEVVETDTSFLAALDTCLQSVSSCYSCNT